MKHKKDEKEEEDCPVYTWKKYKKHCSIYHPKKAESAHSIGLWRKKESIKMVKKEEEDRGFLMAAGLWRIAINPVFTGV